MAECMVRWQSAWLDGRVQSWVPKQLTVLLELLELTLQSVAICGNQPSSAKAGLPRS
jgi:hypothetical protein